VSSRKEIRWTITAKTRVGLAGLIEPPKLGRSFRATSGWSFGRLRRRCEAARTDDDSRRGGSEVAAHGARAAEDDAANRLLGGTSPGPYAPFVAAFHQGLGETDQQGEAEGERSASVLADCRPTDYRISAIY
jgi:hypothetical protein